MTRRWAFAAALTLAGALAGSCSHEKGSPQFGIAPGFGLFYNDQGAMAALAYGRANSDDVALMLQCRKGSGAIEVTDAVRAEPAARLVLTSGGKTSSFPVKLQTGISDGPRLVTAQATAADPALKGFRKSGKISVAFGDIRYGVEARAHERPGVERFFTECET